VCTELLPPAGYPIAVKYIISYIQEKYNTYKYSDGKLVRHLGNPTADGRTKY
jgi:hypothetical protein